MNLREAARGRECQARLPFVCNRNPETVVLAHIRRGHVAGKSQKPNDLIAVVACSSCHDEIDRRTRRIDAAELDGYVLDAWCRTIDMWAREGLIGRTKK